MLCPGCGTDNLPGAEECESCFTPLSEEGSPKPSSGIQKRLLVERIFQIKPKQPISVAPSETLSRVIELMNQKHMGSILVQDKNSLVGIFTERDALFKVSSDPKELDRPVRDFMTPNPETIDAQHSLAWAINKMSVGGYRHLPVLTQGQVTGIISIRDILAHLWR